MVTRKATKRKSKKVNTNAASNAASRPKSEPKQRARQKVDHDSLLPRIRLKPIEELTPAKLNNEIYKPIRDDDARVRELAIVYATDPARIDPIVHTIDGVVISGHTRLAAAIMAEVEVVPAREYPIRSDDPTFPKLLVAFNNQRVKTTEELFHEALAKVNPKDAYRELKRHRQNRIDIASGIAVKMAFGPAVTRKRISDAKRPFLESIIEALESLREFWPVSNRQVHYVLLNKPPLRHSLKPGSRYRNDLHSYHDLNDMLTRARLTREIEFESVSDETRPHTSWRVYQNAKEFIDKQVSGFLNGYNRDLHSSQPCHVELIVEKLTVVNIVESVARNYCCPMTVGRGYASLDARFKLWQRYRHSMKDRLALVIVSDHDPEGEDLAALLPRSMQDEFEVADVIAVKAALTNSQVRELNLPPKITAKAKSSRRQGFVTQYGEHVFELEAIPPRELQRLVRTGLESVLDIKSFRGEQTKEIQDAAELAACKARIIESLGLTISGKGGAE
jgi:hypothetical protein